MPRPPAARPRTDGTLAIWGLYGAALVGVVTTAARPAGAEADGAMGAAGWDAAEGWRAGMRFLRHPLAPAAATLGIVATLRLPAAAVPAALARALATGGAAALGAAAACPRGLRSEPGDHVAVATTAMSLALTAAASNAGRAAAGGADRMPADPARWVLGAILAVGALPWALADAGIYAGDVPGLRRVVLSRDTPIAPGQIAVHLGHHHGMDGALLALTGLAGSRQLADAQSGMVREAVSFCLAATLAIGMARWFEDLWHEQIVKRGWATWKPPIVVRHGRPEGRRVWAALAVAAAAVHLGWFRPAGDALPARPAPRRRPLHWPAHAPG